jgi:hypothetical protein
MSTDASASIPTGQIRPDSRSLTLRRVVRQHHATVLDNRYVFELGVAAEAWHRFALLVSHEMLFLPTPIRVDVLEFQPAWEPSSEFLEEVSMKPQFRTRRMSVSQERS